MDMRTFKALGVKLPAHIALLVEGRHGIGKSQGAHQVAQVLGLPVKDLRLSLMDVGDFIGLPEMITRAFDNDVAEDAYQRDLQEALVPAASVAAAAAVVLAINARHGRRCETRFAPPSWLVDVSKQPHVLFLDEFNRALPEVLQGAYQLILDRQLNGVPLHPGTRIIAAINPDTNYNVTQMDPALRDRFAVVELEPTLDEWIEHAKAVPVDPILIEFIRRNPGHLEHTGAQDATRVYPSRRSWVRLSEALGHAGVLKEQPDGDAQAMIFAMSSAIVGREAAIALVPHVVDSTRQLTAEDIIDGYDETASGSDARIAKSVPWDSPDRIIALNERLIASYAGKKAWTAAQIKRFGAYFNRLNGELMVALWCGIMRVSNTPAMHKRIAEVAPYCKDAVVAHVRSTGIIPMMNDKDSTSA